MIKQSQIKAYIDKLEEQYDSLNRELVKARAEFDEKRAGIMGEERALRMAIRRAKELIDE